MPRPRKPTAELELSGAFIKHPERKREREHEPVPDGEVGGPPKYFDAEHRAIWREYVAEAAPGVLTKADRKVLESACRLTRKLRVTPAKLKPWLTALAEVLRALDVSEDLIAEMVSDLRAGLGISSQEHALLKACLSSLGMTPADRSKIRVEKPEPKDDDEIAFLN